MTKLESFFIGNTEIGSENIECRDQMPHLLEIKLNFVILDGLAAFSNTIYFLVKIELLDKLVNNKYIASLKRNDSNTAQNESNKPAEITHQFLHGVNLSGMLDELGLDEEICAEEESSLVFLNGRVII